MRGLNIGRRWRVCVPPWEQAPDRGIWMLRIHKMHQSMHFNLTLGARVWRWFIYKRG